MNLISGKLVDKEKSFEYLDKLEDIIIEVKSKSNLSTDAVIAACDAMSKSLNDEEYVPVLIGLGVPEHKAKNELNMVRQMLSKRYLKNRMDIELGDNYNNRTFTPYGSDYIVEHTLKPLGTLLHIVAGNVDALPVFSVIEGLLTSNINIVKLPGADNGLSIAFLSKLIEIEPAIKDYVYVFDYPSEEVESIKKMADVSDAIIIWGGDKAVSSVRSMANPNTRIIEWGHKISFSYISDNATDDELEGIAYNICDTNQLFCSSCQGIFLDTESFEDVKSFAERFIKILDTKSKKMTFNNDKYLMAQKTLESYTESLEAIKTTKHVLKTENCGVIAYDDSTLMLSYMFRHCWIKPLPKDRLLDGLNKYKNHLQTVALICEDENRIYFENLLSKTGVVRICDGNNMSQNYCGLPHDGEFSLLKYMKVVSYQR